MHMAEGIRSKGFRRWHERALIASHGWLLTTIVAAFAAFGALEALLGSSGWIDRGGFALAMFFCGAVAVAALQRFLTAIVRAQRAAAQARCSACEAFGRLEVVDASAARERIRVRCRACGHDWTMDAD